MTDAAAGRGAVKMCGTAKAATLRPAYVIIRKIQVFHMRYRTARSQRYFRALRTLARRRQSRYPRRFSVRPVVQFGDGGRCGLLGSPDVLNASSGYSGPIRCNIKSGGWPAWGGGNRIG